MAKHSWQYWNGEIGKANITQRCRKCFLQRRVIFQHNHYIQQYKFYGKNWIRGHDGSILFDHGGTPECKSL